MNEGNEDPDSNVRPFRPSISRNEMNIIKGNDPNLWVICTEEDLKRILAIIYRRTENYMIREYYKTCQLFEQFRIIQELKSNTSPEAFIDFYDANKRQNQTGT